MVGPRIPDGRGNPAHSSFLPLPDFVIHATSAWLKAELQVTDPLLELAFGGVLLETSRTRTSPVASESQFSYNPLRTKKGFSKIFNNTSVVEQLKLSLMFSTNTYKSIHTQCICPPPLYNP